QAIDLRRNQRACKMAGCSTCFRRTRQRPSCRDGATLRESRSGEWRQPMKTVLMLVATIKRVFSGPGYGLIALLMVGTMEIHAATESTAVQQLSRGEYLARVGNCLGCHTAKGGQPFAGGLRLTTS